MNGSTVVLTWDGPLAGEAPQNFVIEAGSRRGARDLAVLLVSPLDRSFTATGVWPGVYMVRLRAVRQGVPGAASNEVAVVVGGACVTAPPAPSGLTSTVTGSTVTLTWNAPGGPVTSYVLVAGYAPTTSNAANADTGNSFTSFVATGVPSATYYVRIQAKNACGVGDFSNEAMVVVR